VFPPPPGALGALSLGLPVPPTPKEPVLPCVLPPEEVDGVCKDGERGVTGWIRCIGAPVADCGAGEVVLGAGAEGVVIRGAVVDEPPPPPRCAIAMLAANAKKPVSTSVTRRRCIIRQTLTEAGRSPKSRLAANLVFCWSSCKCARWGGDPADPRSCTAIASFDSPAKGYPGHSRSLLRRRTFHLCHGRSSMLDRCPVP